MIERFARFLDERIGTSRFLADKATKVFPESWTFLFGELALYSLVVLLISGIWLSFFFDASLAETTYEGAYGPLVGVEMSEAYRSAIALSFDVPAGLFVRQVHHWAALLFMATILVHLLRIFFTGAFRRPRDVNWVIGVTLLVLGIVEGFLGYSLLDDVLSGVGVRILQAVLLSIPVAGESLALLVFGGEFPGEVIIGRMFMAHVLVLPALLVGAVAVHLALVVRQKHTQFPGAGRTEDNVVGLRLWPAYAARAVGMLWLVAAVLAGLGGFVQINPVWLWGPYDPLEITTAAQPDWYMGWLEGALRLFPPFEPQAFGVMLPQPFIPAIVLPGVLFTGLAAWPWIERRLTGDDADHHLLQRPRDNPARTAFGAAVLAHLAVLFFGGSQDLLAISLNVPLQRVVWTLRILTVVAPLVVGWATYRIAVNLRDGGTRPAGEEAFSELQQTRS